MPYRLLIHDGEKLKIGPPMDIDPETVGKRLKAGWTIEQALELPLPHRRSEPDAPAAPAAGVVVDYPAVFDDR